MTLRVHVHGASGKMGSTVVAALAREHDLVLCGTSGRQDDLAARLAESEPDVVVEFTSAEGALHAIRTALLHGSYVVSGTTGVSREDALGLGNLAEKLELGVVLAPNFALGVILLQRFAEQAARWFQDVEILDLHHDTKRDAPSGTSLHMARRIAAAATTPVNAGRAEGVVLVPGVRGGVVDGVPIHSVRLPGLLAHQEAIFGGPGQTLTLRHDAFDRRAYVPGILLAIRRIVTRRGLLDSLDPLLDDPGT